MNFKHFFSHCYFCLWFFLVSFHQVNAQLVINELYPSPLTGEKEWLEIFNYSQETIRLKDWQIAENIGGIIKNHELIDKNGEATLSAHGFFIVENNRLTLNNGGDTIYLFAPDGTQQDFITYPVISNGKSYARTTDGSSTWAISLSSRGYSNYISTPSVSPPQEELSTFFALELTELFPCPETGDKEWVKVYNSNQAALNLLGFKLKNQNGSTRNLPDQIVPALSSSIVEFSSGLAANSGDQLSLVDPNGETIFVASYPACSAKGVVFTINNDLWQEQKHNLDQVTDSTSQSTKVNTLLEIDSNQIPDINLVSTWQKPLGLVFPVLPIQSNKNLINAFPPQVQSASATAVLSVGPSFKLPLLFLGGADIIISLLGFVCSYYFLVGKFGDEKQAVVDF